MLVEKGYKANKRLPTFLQRHIHSWNVRQQVRDSWLFTIAGIVLYIYTNFRPDCQTALVAQWLWMHDGSERSWDRFLSVSGGFCTLKSLDKAGHDACRQEVERHCIIVFFANLRKGESSFFGAVNATRLPNG